MGYRTEDLYLGAALQVCGHAMTGLERVNGRAVLDFEGDGLEETLTAYYGRRLSVDALSYGEAVRSLKGAVMAVPTARTALRR